MRPLVLSAVLLVCGVTPVAAELFLCGDATTFRGSVFADPSHPPTCPAPYGLSQVPAAQTAAQDALIAAFPKRYLKVVGTAPTGLVAEKTQAEKDAADAALQAQEDERQAYEDLATNNDLCNATRQELEARKDQVVVALQGDIAAITNIDTLKVELTDIITRLINNDYKLMTCLRGRAGPPQ